MDLRRSNLTCISPVLSISLKDPTVILFSYVYTQYLSTSSFILLLSSYLFLSSIFLLFLPAFCCLAFALLLSYFFYLTVPAFVLLSSLNLFLSSILFSQSIHIFHSLFSISSIFFNRFLNNVPSVPFLSSNLQYIHHV